MSKIKIKNLSAEINRRIKLIKTPTSVVDLGEQAGAVYDMPTYVGICLAPQVVTCEGATDEVEVLFDYLSENTPQPIWHLEVYNAETGQLYSSITNNDINENDPHLAESLANNRTSEEIAYNLNGDTGAVIFSSNTSGNIKLKILAYGHDETGNYGIEVSSIHGENITFDFFKNQPYDYDIRGCLLGVGSPMGCEGAGQVTGLAIGYYEPNGENQEDWIVAEQVRLKFNNDERFITLNGTTPPYTTEYSEIGDFFDQYLIGANGDFNQSPFEGEVQFLQNSDPQNPVRFEYELLPSNQTQFRVATFGDNPAHENVTPIFTRACFAPFVSPITCDGAESSVEMAFAIKDGETPTLDVFFLIDNEIVDLMNNPPPYITKEVLNKVYDGSVPAGFSTGNGVLKFTNTDSAPHRIEVYTDNFQNVRIVANHNPTVIELDAELIGAYIGVCLSPTPI